MATLKLNVARKLDLSRAGENEQIGGGTKATSMSLLYPPDEGEEEEEEHPFAVAENLDDPDHDEIVPSSMASSVGPGTYNVANLEATELYAADKKARNNLMNGVRAPLLRSP